MNHNKGKVHCGKVEVLLREAQRGNITFPDITVALVSPPCQGFSTANPGGKNDAVNNSVLAICGQIARLNDPYYIIVENVVGYVNYFILARSIIRMLY